MKTFFRRIVVLYANILCVQTNAMAQLIPSPSDNFKSYKDDGSCPKVPGNIPIAREYEGAGRVANGQVLTFVLVPIRTLPGSYQRLTDWVRKNGMSFFIWGVGDGIQVWGEPVRVATTLGIEVHTERHGKLSTLKVQGKPNLPKSIAKCAFKGQVFNFQSAAYVSDPLCLATKGGFTLGNAIGGECPVKNIKQRSLHIPGI